MAGWQDRCLLLGRGTAALMARHLAVIPAFFLGVAAGLWLAHGIGYLNGAPSASAEKKPLYYRHPMGAADISPTPKKDAMGMDYLPVYDGDFSAGRALDIAPEKIQRLGVRTEKAEKRKLEHSLRAFGEVRVDEERVYAVTSQYEGWIKRLFITASGVAVKRGQPLMDIYSPDLVAVQREYLDARRRADTLGKAKKPARDAAEHDAANAWQRLSQWGVGPEQLRQLQAPDSAPVQEMPLLSPFDGVVLEKKAEEGGRFWRGETLFRIAELSKVWFVAGVAEQDLGWIRKGLAVRVTIDAYPGREFRGRIDYIAPELSSATRTVPVRVEMPNDAGLLKLGLYGSLELTAADPAESLAVPDSAVIDSGTRQVVIVRQGEGAFDPRAVKLGRKVGAYFEVLDGLKEGEAVVTRANFLIDAESNLKAALEGMTTPGGRQKPASAPPSGN